jgi:hypothetical protein
MVAEMIGDTLMMKLLRSLKITSDMMYFGAFASILFSIISWKFRKDEQDEPAGERFGIFVGLWAPTFAILGRALEEQEEKIKVKV